MEAELPRQEKIRFCEDDELGYDRDRTRFAAGSGLALDEAYRLAHLPLIAPDHPRVIARRDGAFYDRGRHPKVYSVVLPLPWQALSASPAFRELEADVRASLFAPKIAWELVEQRRHRLHATICGSIATGADSPPQITKAQRRELADLGPIQVELRGLFSGNVNVGRLYLRVYPARRDGDNVLRRIQRVLGGRETDLYVVGLYNLIDDLNAAETQSLIETIERWWSRSILRLNVTRLWLIWAMDDLVLDGAVAQEIALAPIRRP
jgi:hypothetical protein